jgi:putative (di)nucleoside polyphosphate hydrolase
MSHELPYRPCVGVALINRAGDAFIGHRKRKRSAEVLDARSWQMPQGGIDAGEEPLAAARRELWETQKWFLFRFVGPDKEIDVRRPADGAHEAEFDDWRWERFERLPELVVPFKRDIYETVAAAFAPLARPAGR